MTSFTEEDYNSGDGMLTSVWGPMQWHILHVISFNYPVAPTSADKEKYYKYIISLGDVLPCKYCRDNYKKNLKVTKFSKKMLKNRDIFSKFVYKLHSHVNKMLGKKVDLTYKEVRDRYENFRARCVDEVPTIPKHREKGCVSSLYGMKSKCVVNIVPRSSKKKGFQIDKKCKVKRSNKSKSVPKRKK